MSVENGTGSVFGNEIVDEQSQLLGYTTFTAHPIPEPGTGVLVGLGLLGLAGASAGRPAASRKRGSAGMGLKHFDGPHLGTTPR